jgi:type IV secretory pathway VirB10-like protein
MKEKRIQVSISFTFNILELVGIKKIGTIETYAFQFKPTKMEEEGEELTQPEEDFTYNNNGVKNPPIASEETNPKSPEPLKNETAEPETKSSPKPSSTEPSNSQSPSNNNNNNNNNNHNNDSNNNNSNDNLNDNQNENNNDIIAVEEKISDPANSNQNSNGDFTLTPYTDLIPFDFVSIISLPYY